MPSAGLQPIACNVSETQPGETVLTRMEIDGSARYRANQSVEVANALKQCRSAASHASK
jgi:hypothetical protein